MIKKHLMIWASVTLALSAAPQTTPTATSSLVTVINVTAFGAKGHGVTDDRPAIQAAIDVSLKNLTVQGAVPLTVMETYGFVAEDCEFLADTRVGHPNVVTTFDLNTLRSFQFVRNVIGSVGPGYVGIELPQRNSQDGLFEENTMRVTSLGFGEYGAHWRFLGNHLWLYPKPKTAVAISISGLDVLFSRNDGGN